MDVRARGRVVVGIVAAGLLVSGCQDSPARGVARVNDSPSATPATATAFQAVVSPADQAIGVMPGEPVVVTARAGTLGAVLVRDTQGGELEGKFDAVRRSWTSTTGVRVGRTYHVSVEGSGPAGSSSVRTTFSTVRPAKTMRARVAPLNGSTMGVGQPIVVYLTAPASERGAVQRALRVDSSPRVEGAWHWFSDTEVHFRPREYWPAGTKVTLRVNLDGVHAGNNVWGDQDRVIRFTIGPSMISTVDVTARTLTVRRDGKVLKILPVTTGKAGFLTRAGIKVVLEKTQHKVMDASTIGIPKSSPEYYRLDVYWAMRVTTSGEFVHAAPWSESQQGLANVSHGCVGMSTEDARWLFSLTRPGDIVEVINSPRALERGNGWTDWNLSWSQWVSGSATG